MFRLAFFLGWIIVKDEWHVYHIVMILNKIIWQLKLPYSFTSRFYLHVPTQRWSISGWDFFEWLNWSNAVLQIGKSITIFFYYTVLWKCIEFCRIPDMIMQEKKYEHNVGSNFCHFYTVFMHVHCTMGLKIKSYWAKPLKPQNGSSL